MKRVALLIVSACLMLLASVSNAMAQGGVYTRAYSKKEIKEARKWLKSGEWRQGFTAADADKSVNVVEFYTQYKKNPEQWKALFNWLAATDLLSISGGKHPIEGTKLIASVEDSQNEDLIKRKSESHYHHIDFQYVVKGTERFGLIDHNTSTPNTRYRPDVIHYNYNPELTKFVDSRPDRFLIFFPCDWHIAKVKTDKENQNIRVIVIKVDYID